MYSLQVFDESFISKQKATGKSIILYTSAVNASIFPRADLKEKEVAVIEMISKHLPPTKVKIKA